MLSVVADVDRTHEDIATFNDFWTLWPKRVARMEAERAWQRLSSVQHVEALTALVSWRSVWLARGELQYVPNASTWLNQQRWTDELPETWANRPHSHTPFPERVDEARGVMPDSVRAAIAKLRR